MAKSAKAKKHGSLISQVKDNNNNDKKEVDKVQSNNGDNNRSSKKQRSDAKREKKASSQNQQKSAFDIVVGSSDKLVAPTTQDHPSLMAHGIYYLRYMQYINSVVNAAKDKNVPEYVRNMLNISAEKDADDKLMLEELKHPMPAINPDKEYDVYLNHEFVKPATKKSSKRTRGATAAPDSDEDEEEDPNYVYEDLATGERIRKRKIVGEIQKLKANIIDAMELRCAELIQDRKLVGEKVKKWEEENLSLGSDQKTMFKLMHDRLSEESKKLVYDKMAKKKEVVVAEQDFNALRNAVFHTHHPEFIDIFNPREKFEERLINYASSLERPAQKEKEPMEDFCIRFKEYYGFLEKVEAACKVLKYTRPDLKRFIRQVAKGVNAKSISASKYCSAGLGNDALATVDFPETMDGFVEILKLKDIIDLNKTKKEKKREEQNQALVFNSILSKTQNDDSDNSKAKKRPNSNTRVFTDVAPAITQRVIPSKLDDETFQALLKAMMNDDRAKEIASQGQSQKRGNKNVSFEKQDKKRAKPNPRFNPGAEPKGKGKGNNASKTQGARKSGMTLFNGFSNASSNVSDDEGSDDDEDQYDDDDDKDEEAEISFTSNQNIITHNVLEHLEKMQHKEIEIRELILLGLIDPKHAKTFTFTNFNKKYDIERHSKFVKFDPTLLNKLKVAMKGVVVKDSGSSVHITRDRELLVEGSIREVPNNLRIAVNGTFGTGHSIKHYAQHKNLGFTLYDPNAAANIISFSYCWATGWQFYIDNEKKQFIMSHPERDASCNYLFAIGPEKVLVGMDPVSFKSWNPTFSVKPLGFLTQLLEEKLSRKKYSPSLLEELSQEDTQAFAYANLDGRQRKGTYEH